MCSTKLLVVLLSTRPVTFAAAFVLSSSFFYYYLYFFYIDIYYDVNVIVLVSMFCSVPPCHFLPSYFMSIPII